MLGEVIAYSVGKAVAKRRYRRQSSKKDYGADFCLCCGYNTVRCGNFEDFCIECCNCTEHTD